MHFAAEHESEIGAAPAQEPTAAVLIADDPTPIIDASNKGTTNARARAHVTAMAVDEALIWRPAHSHTI